MAEEPEVLDGEEVGPDPELAPAVDEKLPADLVVRDPDDVTQVIAAMDEHDLQMLLQEVQSKALRKWVYDLPGGKGAGLTVHAVQDIVQRMNWTQKCAIGLLPETLAVRETEKDAGHGLEPFYEVTIFATDTVSGLTQSGTDMEPQWMRLRDGSTKFDTKALTKAVNKAERNAMAKFIPEEIEQAVIGMALNDPSRVERIQTEAEVRMSELPPPLDDDEAKALLSKAEEVYDRIRELGGGQGKVKLPPGTFGAYKINAQHSHDRLRDMIAWLEQREQEIPVELKREGEQREAVATANEVPCPQCEQPKKKACKGIRGAHAQRIQARLDQIRGAS